METKKRKTMALLVGNMPIDVFNILEEERNRRNLTQFIVNLVRESQKNTELLKYLKTIEEKIDKLNDRTVTIKKNESKDDWNNSLLEGQIINTDKFIGSMDKEDMIDIDF